MFAKWALTAVNKRTLYSIYIYGDLVQQYVLHKINIKPANISVLTLIVMLELKQTFFGDPCT